MALDRIDGIAFVGFVLVGVAATVLDGALAAAALAGVLLSVASWRLYGGRPWEALGWLSWVGAAVTLVIDPGGLTFLVAFGGFGLVGICLLVGDRLGFLPDVWTVGTATN
ncbi:hypothetical protein EA462_05845 [Natrarchaeobius halalkaliphilus]|uniref:Uncharacterized protein n=1 Tax=Natrarchaeobius halalkaliphilus TaxID=1679091 RepID=A0A3N6LV22_9EURY|nr:hypothetical protein [Natrarchaeobius halalkaliphilus]RQG91484.1 hypothetical protein EA462_05845 [Natrarchaeobius halalkaliphilus]